MILKIKNAKRKKNGRVKFWEREGFRVVIFLCYESRIKCVTYNGFREIMNNIFID